MTEPENFDDELFADLYSDDEHGGGRTAAAPPAAEPSQLVQPPTEMKQESIEDYGQEQHYNGGDSHMNNEEYDDEDDDVDFNLGDGPTAVASYQEEKQPVASYNTPSAPPPPTRGPNAKEDG
ncbi:hypothetical protein QBC47DRAFT_367470 [Echria macrotheca]|uniref:Uncharacterized protein n=1 Tax=Echria macrotheca TaxID=438768 RepID=A0AAJ0BR72_9PEZI|nr:hypothetical protein QBC47DRAFT_367470 [Echria macrotheca]